MPKFRVTLEKIKSVTYRAEVEVEAEDRDAAEDEAIDQADFGDVNWEKQQDDYDIDKTTIFDVEEIGETNSCFGNEAGCECKTVFKRLELK